MIILNDEYHVIEKLKHYRQANYKLNYKLYGLICCILLIRKGLGNFRITNTNKIK